MRLKPQKRRQGPEACLIAACLEYLQLKRIFAWRNNSGGMKVGKRFLRFGMPGSPDIIGIVDGCFLAIETKAPKGELSESQIAWHQQAKRAGCTVHVVRSLDDLMEVVG